MKLTANISEAEKGQARQCRDEIRPAFRTPTSTGVVSAKPNRFECGGRVGSRKVYGNHSGEINLYFLKRKHRDQTASQLWSQARLSAEEPVKTEMEFTGAH